MTLWAAAFLGSLSFTISCSVFKRMSIESVTLSSPLSLSYPLFLLPSIFPSIEGRGNLSCESALRIRWPEHWSFSFSISLSSEYSGLISFNVYWLLSPCCLRILKSLLQHRSLKASVLWCSALFMVQLSHPYMTTGKTIALTI